MRILGLGGVEWLVILLVVALVFGTGKIAGLGPALGKSIRGFREALKGEDEKKPNETIQAPTAATAKSNTNKES
jgi:sec-independent protein translocase protein TatA